jgi:CHAT domain-containing protein/tetratricopeptide (TPR) repeat protein
MKQTSLTMALVAVVVLARMHPLPAQDKEGEAEAVALLRQVQALQKAGKLAEAVKVQEKLVEKVKQLFGPDDTSTAAQINNLAELYRAVGRYAKAEPLFQRSVKIAEARLGKDHPSVATALNNLGSLYQTMGQYAKAEPLYQRSLEIREIRLGKDHPDVAGSLNNLAGLYKDRGEHAKAEPLYRRSLTIYEARLGTDHPLVAIALNNLALLYQDMGQYAKAEPLYQRSLEIREAKLGKDNLEVATTLNNLAALYKAMGQYAKAGPLYQRSLTISEAKLGKDHPDVATALHNLAELYLDMSQYARAEPLYQRSLKISEARLGKDHPDVADSLNGLGALYKATGQSARAEPLLKRSLAIREAKLGKDHPLVAVSLNNLAVLYDEMGQYAKAEPLYQRSLAIREAKLGKDHPDVAQSLNNLAVLYAARKEAPEAGRLFDRARRSARRYLASVLPALSDADKAAFFSNTTARGSLEGALSLALSQKSDAALAEQAANWLVNGKAIDQESLASSALLTRQSNDPTLGKLARQLLSVRQQLARLSFATPRPGQEKQHMRQIEALTVQEQHLARQLRLAGSKAVSPPWVEPAQLRQALPADAVLIDLAHFLVIDFKAKRDKQWQSARYAAWVTSKRGAVRLIDLGPAEKIDAAVQRFRATMQGAAKQIKDNTVGEEKAEKALRADLDVLAKLVLAPLLPHIGTTKRWLISPDGSLWLLPWEALALKDGKYALEEHQISYLTSGRDLLPALPTKVKVSAPLVLADPDFDLDPTKARAEEKRLLAKGSEEEAMRALSGGLRLGRVGRLAGTAAEAKAIAPRLAAYGGVAPQIHLGGQALEAVVKAARNPRVLVLCTHGFFLPDQEVPRDDKTGASKPKAAKKWENPLLRCGLLLAGCNNAAKVTDGDDGVLTGLEVVGTDLRGCELVVLSACDTGVGEVQSGEGVAGLRQAFQLAGAQAVVSTLWQVPDKQSARLMALFFQNLSAGKRSRAEALRAAKLKIIEERRDDLAAAHPFFWAAFTLTGEP